MSLAEAEPTHGYLASHFETLEQQHQSAALGMWTFLATEVMFFGGLFLGFSVYRFVDPEPFAIASRHLNVTLGTINTFVLLTSSLTMALVVRAGQTGDRKAQVRNLLLTMALATLFLGIKAREYYEEFEHHLAPGASFSTAALHLPEDAPESLGQQAQLFFVFYFFMTGLHGFHMLIGIAVMAVLLVKAQRGQYTAEHYTQLEMTGLYWHFVDLVWVFLFPLLYLVELHT